MKIDNLPWKFAVSDSTKQDDGGTAIDRLPWRRLYLLYDCRKSKSNHQLRCHCGPLSSKCHRKACAWNRNRLPWANNMMWQFVTSFYTFHLVFRIRTRRSRWTNRSRVSSCQVWRWAFNMEWNCRNFRIPCLLLAASKWTIAAWRWAWDEFENARSHRLGWISGRFTKGRSCVPRNVRYQLECLSCTREKASALAILICA